MVPIKLHAHQFLFLTGFMGSGKTSIGRLLSNHLALPFLDLDEVIVERIGSSIPNIFASQGEARFRQYELETLQSLKPCAVVSLGGGSITVEPLRRFILASGVSVYLDWPFEVLRRRIQNDPNRPLAGDLEKAKALFDARLSAYQQAQLTWRSEPPHEETPAQTCAWILEQISKN